MLPFPAYQVSSSDTFDPKQLILIQEEVTAINYRLVHCPSEFKSAILISFLKSHSIKKEWIIANPQLANLVSGGSLFNGNIESLFASCYQNPGYTLAFEKYLDAEFTGQ